LLRSLDAAIVQLEGENGKLSKLAADLSLDKEMLQDVIRPKLLKPGRKRKLVDEVRSEWQISIRKACDALEFDRSTTVLKPCAEIFSTDCEDTKVVHNGDSCLR
jgi:hypothetical protein